MKRFRIIFSLLVLIGITYLFTAVRVQNISWLSWLIKAQFIPALFASLWVLAAILLLTLLFGRIYCSWLCSMGVFQDVVIRLARLFKTKKQKRFRWTKEARLLRYTILTLIVALWIVGFTLPLLLFDPYSNYGRIAVHLFKPLINFLNNGLHTLLPNTVYYHSYMPASLWGLLLPVVIFVVVAGMSVVRGRLFCNTVCPVGSVLGLISKFSVFRPTIDKDRCTHCGVCTFQCKAECINNKTLEVDHSRCVACFNCTTACTQRGAMSYRFSWKRRSNPKNETRRAFLAAAGGVVGAAAIYQLSGGSSLAGASLQSTVAPPGARSHAHLKKFCTACQACVAACPSRIIRPTVKGYGIDGWMLPALSFKEGFCSYNCNRCSEVCPTGALERTTIEEKKRIRMGVAKFTPKICVVTTDRTDCGACDEHCPTKAIRLVPFGKSGLRRPQVDEAYCIGCGACEFICPTTPKAIVVRAKTVHDAALPPVVEKQERVIADDFGF